MLVTLPPQPLASALHMSQSGDMTNASIGLLIGPRNARAVSEQVLEGIRNSARLG